MLNEDSTKAPGAQETPAEEPKDDRMDRRSAARKAGKFLTYTAPALVALIAAKNAHAS